MTSVYKWTQTTKKSAKITKNSSFSNTLRLASHDIRLEVGLKYHMYADLQLFVGSFLCFHILCVQTAKTLVRLPGCAGSLEPSLCAYVISTLFLMEGLICRIKYGAVFCFSHCPWLCLFGFSSVSSQRITLMDLDQILYMHWFLCTFLFS